MGLQKIQQKQRIAISIDALICQNYRTGKIQKLNMPSVWIFIFLPFLCCSLNFYRLSTLGQQSLKTNYYVYSTLGYFRLSLEPKTCQFRVEYFEDNNNENAYKLAGFFPKSVLPECDSLTLNQSGLFTSKGDSFFFFRNQVVLNQTQQNSAKNVKQTFLTIDDTGIIRLESIFMDQSTREKWITNFKMPQKYLVAENNKIIGSSNTLSILKNNGEWGFSASKGQFRIFHLGDRTKIYRYKFLPFILSTNLFKDWNDFTTPLLNFQGLKYERRCGISKQVSFRSPFVFVISKFWPQLRVLDQEGYEIFSMRYPTLNCIKDIGVDQLIDNQDCIPWFCPPETFQLNGKCLAKCPSPYFHQIKQNKINRCVLICEAGSQIDNQTRICTCVQQQDIQCPHNLTQTPFGCMCKNKRYFFNNGLVTNLKNRSLEEICLKNCPLRYYEYSQGICVSCPIFCLRCVISNNSIGFLRCLQCEQGFEIFNFICRKRCQNKVGNYLSPLSYDCQNCTIKNCKKCIVSGNGVQVCQECTLPFTFFNNTCLSSCPKNYILNFVESRYFACSNITQCTSLANTEKFSVVSQCKACGGRQYCFQNCEQTSYQYFHNKSNCFCIENSSPSYVLYCNYSVKDERKNHINLNNFLQKNPCPAIHYYFNYRTNECLECPFGCLTCLVNDKGLPECTSCVENYYLSVYDSTYCQRQTSLAYCYEFDPSEKYCFSWEDITTLLQKEPNHSLCKKQNPNCFICLYKSTSYCKFCQKEYYLHEGKCISSCPEGFYPYKYQRVCLKQTIKNCQQQTILPLNFLINANSNTQYTEGYRYFTSKYFTQIQNENDPIGLIFVYYGYLKKKIEGQRISTFTKAKATCKTCKPGFGLTLQGQCNKCFSNCEICILSYTFSCIRCHPFYYLSDRQECLPLSQQQRPCLEGQYRNQKSLCSNQCPQFKRIFSKQLPFETNQKTVNCTLNCPSSMTIMKAANRSLFCVDQNMKTQFSLQSNSPLSDLQQISTNPIQLIASCYTGQQNGGLCVLVPTVLVKNISKNSLKVDIIKTSQARLLQEKNLSLQTGFQNGIIYFKGMSEGILKVVFSVEQFSNPQLNEYLGNSIYGFEVKEGSTLLDQILSSDRGMHNYSRTLLILFFLVTVINIGKGLDYKTDNTFITMGVVYLALTSFNISLSKAFYLLVGWMYGFSWSLGLQMFSNPRYLTYHGIFFSDGYIQIADSNAHSLLFVDDNFLRNCWSIFILIFIIVGLLTSSWLFIAIFTGRIFNKCTKKSVIVDHQNESDEKLKLSGSSEQMKKTNAQIHLPLSYQCVRHFPLLDFDHFSKIRIFCIFIFENCFMALCYYSFLQISSSSWEFAPNSVLSGHKALAWIVLIFLIGYFIVRSYTNHVAGIYLLKRILIAFVLTLNPASKGLISLFLELVCVELVFIGFRICFQCRDQVIKIKSFLRTKIFNPQKKNDEPKLAEQGVKVSSQKQEITKVQQVFQLQKAIISHNNILSLPQESEMNKISKKEVNFSKNLKTEVEHEAQKKPSAWNQMSPQIKILIFEEILIILIYLMIPLSQISAEVSVFVMLVVFLIFLIAFLDQLIVNLIQFTEMTSKKMVTEENSLISQMNQKHNFNRQNYYFKIRNNFDYECQTKNSSGFDFSNNSAREKRLTITSSYIHSII